LRKRRKASTQKHCGEETVAQTNQPKQAMLNLKLQRREFLRANRSQIKIWSGMEHVVTTASWSLREAKAYKSNWASSFFFFKNIVLLACFVLAFVLASLYLNSLGLDGAGLQLSGIYKCNPNNKWE